MKTQPVLKPMNTNTLRYTTPQPNRRLARLAAVACVALACLLAVPLQAQAYKKGQKTAQDLQDLSREVHEGGKQIGLVMNALNHMLTAPGADLRKQYSEFEKAAKKMGSIADSARKRRIAIQANRQEYIKAWDAELAKIQNEDIKSRGLQRRQEVDSQLQKAATAAATAGADYRAFEADIVDIQKYLATDLTRAGIEAIRPVAKTADEHAGKIRASLLEVETQLKALGIAMSAEQPKKK